MNLVRRNIRLLAPFLFVLCLASLATLYFVLSRNTTQHGFLPQHYTDQDGRSWKYKLFVPFSYNYSGSEAFPLIVFLHGWSKRGTDGHSPLIGGMGPAVTGRLKTFPFITLFPQSEKGPWNAESEDSARALRILEDVQQRYRVDARRIYLTGPSSGGSGVWSWATAYPDKWAAIVPVAWDFRKDKLSLISHIPCWYFASVNDEQVSVERSRSMVQALKDVKGNPKYTEFIGHGDGNHLIDLEVYGHEELYQWLLQQSLQ